MTTIIHATDKDPAPGRWSILTDVAQWWRDNGHTWIYIFKTVLAVLLALLISMTLDLPQPRTAMITVCILMQPQSGAVLAKSFYRFFATAFGLLVMMVFISLFAQEPVLYLSSIAMWVCVCSVGAARNRNFRSYGFVLAGYTAALIGVSAGQHPEGAFITAMTRVAETCVGIICAGAVSALIFPRHVSDQIKLMMRRRFDVFAAHLDRTIRGSVDRAEAELVHTQFSEQTLALEGARSIGVFELPHTRMRGQRLTRANLEFVNAATRLHMLNQQWLRLNTRFKFDTHDELTRILEDIGAILRPSGKAPASAAEAQPVGYELRKYQQKLAQYIDIARERQSGNEALTVAFDSCAELLTRFAADLLAYVESYASLTSDRHRREKDSTRFITKTSLLPSLIAGSRAALLTGVLSLFWIQSAWPSGGSMVLSATAVCALAATSPQPGRFSKQMFLGTLLAAVLGGVLQFAVYPRIDGFPLLASSLAPFLALGAALMGRPKTIGMGVGFCIYLSLMAGPDLVTQYDPYLYVNDAIANVLAMLAVWMSFAVYFPTDGLWLRKLLLRSLKRQIHVACTENLHNLALRFESSSRDIVAQINAVAPSNSSRIEPSRWLLLVLSVGRVIIDMREEFQPIKETGTPSAELMAWMSHFKTMTRSIEKLFLSTSREKCRDAISNVTTLHEETVVLSTLRTLSDDERRRLSRVRALLLYLRDELHDRSSPLYERLRQAEGR